MQKLVQGVHHFQSHVFETEKDLFDRLSRGQRPDTLFITCSDSRINPNLITQTAPGELFIIRNAGNIIPPYGIDHGGETATVEYAVSALEVKDIIICGHSLCGAMSALLEPELIQDLPAVSRWLGYAETTRRIVKENYSHLCGNDLLLATVEENVLNQLENLSNHPSVAAKLSRKELHLHAWIYKIETGEVYAYDPPQEQFVPLRDEATPIVPRPFRRQAHSHRQAT
jgi:carbonic anhydrase